MSDSHPYTKKGFALFCSFPHNKRAIRSKKPKSEFPTLLLCCAESVDSALINTASTYYIITVERKGRQMRVSAVRTRLGTMCTRGSVLQLFITCNGPRTCYSNLKPFGLDIESRAADLNILLYTRIDNPFSNLRLQGY